MAYNKQMAEEGEFSGVKDAMMADPEGAYKKYQRAILHYNPMYHAINDMTAKYGADYTAMAFGDDPKFMKELKAAQVTYVRQALEDAGASPAVIDYFVKTNYGGI